MRRLASVAVLLLTSQFAAASNPLMVRSVSVADSNTYTIEGSGFSPKKGAAPVVTINGLAVTVKSFTDTRIVGTLATRPAGVSTLKVTNSQGLSTTFEVVLEPPQKEACQIKEVSPGMIVPPLPSYCFAH